jgi:hypothetical protein
MSYKGEVRLLINNAYRFINKSRHILAVPILEKAVSIAGEHDDVLFEMYCRFELTDCYAFAGDIIKAFINFTWCVNQMEKGYVNDKVIFNIIWHYKYITDEIYNYVDIPLEKINELFKKMKKMFIENNVSLNPYYGLRVKACTSGIDTGVDVREYYRKWMLEPEDDNYGDCSACVLNRKVSYHIFLNNYERALKEAENIINGTYKCSQIPHITFAELLLPVYALGEYKTAEMLQIKGLRLIDGDKTFVRETSYHIMYLSLVNIEKAVKVFEKNYPNHLTCNGDHRKMLFNAAAFVLFSKLQERDNETIKLKMPKEASIYSKEGCDVSDLKEFFRNETLKIMNAFDRRNENYVVSDNLRKYLEICGVML